MLVSLVCSLTHGALKKKNYPICKANLAYILYELSQLLFSNYKNTTAYNLDQYEPSSLCTKEHIGLPI